jgi:hypothetical protein
MYLVHIISQIHQFSNKFKKLIFTIISDWCKGLTQYTWICSTIKLPLPVVCDKWFFGAWVTLVYIHPNGFAITLKDIFGSMLTNSIFFWDLLLAPPGFPQAPPKITKICDRLVNIETQPPPMKILKFITFVMWKAN